MDLIYKPTRATECGGFLAPSRSSNSFPGDAVYPTNKTGRALLVGFRPSAQHL